METHYPIHDETDDLVYLSEQYDAAVIVLSSILFCAVIVVVGVFQ